MEYNIYPKSDTEKIEKKIVKDLNEIRQEKCRKLYEENQLLPPSYRKKNVFTQKNLSSTLKEKTRFISELENGIIKLDFRTFINLCNRFKISSSSILSEFITEDIKISSNKAINEFKNPLPNNLPQTEPKKYNGKILGQEIKKYRKIKKLSQRGLSQSLGFGHGYINNIEQGINDVSISAFIDICNKLECTPNDLLYPFIKNKNTTNNVLELKQNFINTSKKDISNNLFEETRRTLSKEELEEFNRKYPKSKIPKLSKKEENSYYSDIEKYNLY